MTILVRLSTASSAKALSKMAGERGTSQLFSSFCSDLQSSNSIDDAAKTATALANTAWSSGDAEGEPRASVSRAASRLSRAAKGLSVAGGSAGGSCLLLGLGAPVVREGDWRGSSVSDPRGGACNRVEAAARSVRLMSREGGSEKRDLQALDSLRQRVPDSSCLLLASLRRTSMISFLALRNELKKLVVQQVPEHTLSSPKSRPALRGLPSAEAGVIFVFCLCCGRSLAAGGSLLSWRERWSVEAVLHDRASARR